MRRAEAIVPAITPASRCRRRAFVMEYLDRPSTRCGSSSSWPGAPTPRWPADSASPSATIHASTAADRRRARRVRQPADVRRAAPRPLPRRHRARPSRPGRRSSPPSAPSTRRHRPALVHGDVSPKNILVGPKGPVLLDAECATCGRPRVRRRLLRQPPAAEVRVAARDDRAASSTAPRPDRRPTSTGVTWEEPAALDARVAPLVPALMLARIDGLSPVEYLDEPARGTVRRAARACSTDPPRDRWRAAAGLARGCDPAQHVTAQITVRATAGGSGTRGAGRPSRPRCAAAGQGGRSLRPARRRAAARPSSCATAAHLRRPRRPPRGRPTSTGRSPRPWSAATPPTRPRIDGVLVGLDVADLAPLGGNAVVATSMACARAAAAVGGEPLWRTCRARASTLPLPEIQIFGGGAHAGRRIDIQDFMVMAPGAASFAEALDWTAEIYRAAGDAAISAALAGVADEGGWWPAFDSNEEAIETLARAIEPPGSSPGATSASRSTSLHPSCGRRPVPPALETGLDSDAMVSCRSAGSRDYRSPRSRIRSAEDDAAGMGCSPPRPGTRPGRRRRLPRDRASASARRDGVGQRRARQAEPGRHADTRAKARSTPPGAGFARHRLGAFG